MSQAYRKGGNIHKDRKGKGYLQKQTEIGVRKFERTKRRGAIYHSRKARGY